MAATRNNGPKPPAPKKPIGMSAGPKPGKHEAAKFGHGAVDTTDDDEGGTIWHVGIKNGFSALFKAESKAEAKQKYLEYFGIIATDHRIVVTEATEEQIEEDAEKRRLLEEGRKSDADSDAEAAANKSKKSKGDDEE